MITEALNRHKSPNKLIHGINIVAYICTDNIKLLYTQMTTRKDTIATIVAFILYSQNALDHSYCM